MSHIYENPVETEVDLLARTSPVSVNFQKCAGTFALSCSGHFYGHSDVTVRHFDSSCEIFENSNTEIYRNRKIRKIYKLGFNKI